MATDASTPGYGVTYCNASSTAELLRFVDAKGCHVVLQPAPAPGVTEVPLPPHIHREDPALRLWILNQQRKVAVMGQFRVRSHINRQELIACILALRWLGQQRRFHGTRVYLLCDSKVVVGCCAKGRSSARALIALLRRYADLSLTFQIQLSLIWVSSESNPADGPSRGVAVFAPDL